MRATVIATPEEKEDGVSIYYAPMYLKAAAKYLTTRFFVHYNIFL